MSYLLDTHVLLWAMLSLKKLSESTHSLFQKNTSEFYVSTITFWEISLKYGLGKINLFELNPEEIPSFAKKMGFETLDLETETLATFHLLPLTDHKDPFDRMLVWQSINSNVTLITKDKSLDVYQKYGLKTYW